MHHVDVHVRDIAATKRLFDAVGPAIGIELRSNEPDFVSYWSGKRPSYGFLLDCGHRAGSMRIAFGVATRDAVDRAATAARDAGARAIEGPGFHPEYGDDYYAVFFEDADGNKYEVCCDPETV